MLTLIKVNIPKEPQGLLHLCCLSSKSGTWFCSNESLFAGVYNTSCWHASGVKSPGVSLGICAEMLRWNFQSASKRMPDLMFILPSCRDGLPQRAHPGGSKVRTRQTPDRVCQTGQWQWLDIWRLSLWEKWALYTCSLASCLQTLHVGH